MPTYDIQSAMDVTEADLTWDVLCRGCVGTKYFLFCIAHLCHSQSGQHYQSMVSLRYVRGFTFPCPLGGRVLDFAHYVSGQKTCAFPETPEETILWDLKGKAEHQGLLEVLRFHATLGSLVS